MNTSTEMAVGLGVVALAGTLLYFNMAGSDDPDKEKKEKDDKWKKANQWDCSEQQGGSDSPLGHLVNQIGDWTGAQSCTSGAASSKLKKRTVTIFTGYGSSGPATCDPNDDDCDDDRERDCDVVHTMNIDLTEEDIAQKRSAHLLIESDADIQYLKDQCKAEKAARQRQIAASRDEDGRFANLRTRLFNQFQLDVTAGKDVGKTYTPAWLKTQCAAAQLGAQYTQKLLDEFSTAVAAAVANNKTHVVAFPVKYKYADRGVTADKLSADMIATWKAAIDKARPDGPWPNFPTYDELMKDTIGFTPAQAHNIEDTLLKYRAEAQMNSTFWQNQNKK